MSYSKTNWANNSAPAINADNLNKIEPGIYDNDAAIASANTNIGTLTNLTTTEKSNLVGAINEVNSNTDINATNIGDLSDLETTANTDLVSAINEVDGNTDINTAKLNGTQAAGDMVVDSIKTKNMYNIDTDILNMILNASGGLTQGTGYRTSEFIKVKPNTNYTISKVVDTSITGSSVDDNMRIGYFTSNKTFISRPVSTDNPYSVTTPATCEYVKISYQQYVSNQLYVSNVQLEEGSTATTYKKYQNLDIENGIWKDISSSVGVSTTQMSNLLLHSAYAKKVGNMVSISIILRTSTDIPTGVNLNACCWINDNTYFPNTNIISYCMTHDNYDYPDWNGNTAENIAFLRVQNDGQIIVRTKKTGQKVIVIHITY